MEGGTGGAALLARRERRRTGNRCAFERAAQPQGVEARKLRAGSQSSGRAVAGGFYHTGDVASVDEEGAGS